MRSWLWPRQRGMSHLPLTSGTAVVRRRPLCRCLSFVMVTVTKAGGGVRWRTRFASRFPSQQCKIATRARGSNHCYSDTTCRQCIAPEEKEAIASWKLAHSSAFGRSIFVLLLPVKARIMSIGKGNIMVLVRSVAILLTV